MIKYTIEKHAVAFPSKVIARNGGEHIYNIQLTTATDNGAFVAKGDYVELDLYKEAAATAINAKIQDKASNGQWVVEITDNTDVLCVYNPALIAEDYNNQFKQESNFFMGPGEIGRGYGLHRGDILLCSDENFSGTPVKGAVITAIDAKKLKITA